MGFPRGSLTFLFTDIEASAQLWEQEPEAMERALARHDEIIVGAVESCGGRIFKTGGDSFCCIFASPEGGTAAAVAAQQALCGQVWEGGLELRVRMALHTGPAQQRGDDYFGPALNRVARLLACAHGGQTLLSQRTHELARRRAPRGVAFRDLGQHRLRDLPRPERIFQLLHPDLPQDFPPLRSLHGFAHNLPVQLTSFIGREREIAAVKGLLRNTRLLSLTGVGGAGKTRLALQVAEDVLEDYREGVWFSELESLADPELVPHSVASALGVREEPGRGIVETLLDRLRPRHCLVILDNCEHVLRSCAELADELLRGCPDLKILATSREGLGIAGETTHHVLSLTIPEAGDELTPGEMSGYEAVRLFVDRAQAHEPGFEVAESNAAAIAQICRRLDGIPLAIELAAARVRAMPPQQIADRLDDCFRLLTGGSRTALPRQQTLEALIDWSYDLLDERERTMLRRLSVFVGGWALEAAEAVCSGGAIDEPDVLDLLTSLVSKSVALYQTTDHGARYRLLEMIRQYARERLVDSGEATAVRDRHRGFFLQWAEESTDRLSGPEQAEWLERLDAEHDNLRAALEWCQRDQGGVRAELRLARALSRFWCTRGHLSEGRQRMAAALARASGEGPSVRAGGLVSAAWLAKHHGDYSAAQALFEEALTVRRDSDHTRGTAGCLDGLGQVAFAQGDYSAARTLFEESLALCRELGDKGAIAAGLQSLGLVACLQGDSAGAEASLGESLSIWRDLGNERRVAQCLSDLGLVAFRRGHSPEAQTLQQESLAIRRDLGHTEGMAENLERLAQIRATRADAAGAARLWGAAASLREAIGAPLLPVLRDEHTRNVRAARDVLGDDAFEAAWGEGKAMDAEEAVADALGARKGENL